MNAAGSLRAAMVAAWLAGATAAALAGPVAGQGTWETKLHARDVDGNGSTDAFYDSALNVTWMADWNGPGLIGFEDALDWAANLNVAGLGGWRLPGMTDTGAPGCVSGLDHGTDCGFNSDTSISELAHMFYVTLGNLGRVALGEGCAALSRPGVDPEDGLELGAANSAAQSPRLSAHAADLLSRQASPLVQQR
ncbi:MAG: hypothetical protein H7Z19_20955 [Chitinophagaceae bacterium]|nr:hypothetical protein [Rubrivivax sp.]